LRGELIERGVPDERPIKDLPIERPDFALLYGPERAAEMSKTIEPMHEGGSSIARKRTTRGGEDIEVTDKLTMTWVGSYFLQLAFTETNSSANRHPMLHSTNLPFLPIPLYHIGHYLPESLQNVYARPHADWTNCGEWIWF
jgi:hypothetical protein